MPAPALWYSIADADKATRTELSSDQCIIDEHFFVLGRVVLPVIDGPGPFVWLAWVSLSEKNFLRTCELWEAEGRETEPPCFGWFQSALPYEPSTLNLKASVQTMPVGERPLVTLEDSGHPLAREQLEGITMAQVQKMVEAVLHSGQ
jgi:hypothetical protein